MIARQEAVAWGTLACVFIGVRVALIVGDPSRFWAIEELYQSDIALARFAGLPLEALPSYLYPTFAGGAVVDGLLVAAIGAVFGPTWGLLKAAALGISFAASAVLVATVRGSVGRTAALLLGVMLAVGPPSWMTFQLFLHGNHAEAALLVALSAAGTQALIERDRSRRGQLRLAFALGLLGGFGVFFVYSHLLVVGLQVALVVGARGLPNRGRLLSLAGLGLAVGLVPWAACRLYLGEPLRFDSHAGSMLGILGRLLEGPEALREAARVFPWVGTAEGRPWMELLHPALQGPGRAVAAASRLLLAIGSVGAAALGGLRWMRRQPGSTVPLLFGVHGVVLFLVVAGSSPQARYGQQLVIDGLVGLVLVSAAAWGRPRLRALAALALAVPFLGAVVDTLPQMLPPAPGGAALSAHSLVRFSRGRQTHALQGFRRPELQGIGLWLERRAPSDADFGFALGFPDAAHPLSQRLDWSPPRSMDTAALHGWDAAADLDSTLLLEGLGAAAVVRYGGDEVGALRAFDGGDADRAAYRRGARWMAQELAR